MLLCLFRLLVAPGVPRLVAAELKSLPLSSHSPLLLSLCLSLIRTLVIGFRAHSDNPEWSHLEILDLLASAKTPFQNKVPPEVWGGHIHWWGAITEPPSSKFKDFLLPRQEKSQSKRNAFICTEAFCNILSWPLQFSYKPQLFKIITHL